MVVWGREKLMVWGSGGLWFGAGKAYGLGQWRVMVWGRESVWFGAVEGCGLG